MWRFFFSWFKACVLFLLMLEKSGCGLNEKDFLIIFIFIFFYFLNENWFFWRFYPSSGIKSKTRVFWKLPNQNKYIILFSSSHVSNNFHVFFLHAMPRLFWFFCVIIFIKLVASVSNYKFYLCVSFLYGFGLHGKKYYYQVVCVQF